MLTHNLIPTHEAAMWLLERVDHLLDYVGLSHHPALEQAVYLAAVTAIAIAVGYVVRRIVVWSARRIVRLHDGDTGRRLLKQHVLQKCSHFITPLILLLLAPFAFDTGSRFMHIIDKLMIVYAITTVAYGIGAVLRFVFTQFNSRRNKRNLPLQGVLNIALGMLWSVAAIVSVSVLADKSPGALLAGLGAFAAALMLIFRDSILGFVAGLQMSENDMLHVGDWIYVPGTPANGNVEAVSLSTVKIRNFDNTLVMIPPYTLVSQGFQNYRAMEESGARRMTIDIVINPDSVVRATAATASNLAGMYPALKTFIDRAANTTDGWICDDGNYVVNGTTETNLGMFRAYASGYLKDNPHISKNQMIMVNQKAPTVDGYVLQIYCFACTSAWVAYEGIRSAVLEHLTMALRDFGLVMHSSSYMEIDAHDAATPAQR